MSERLSLISSAEDSGSDVTPTASTEFLSNKQAVVSVAAIADSAGDDADLFDDMA